MHPIVANVAALVVATLFYLWRAHHQLRLERHRVLRQRVAFMLWTAAEQVEEAGPHFSLQARG